MIGQKLRAEQPLSVGAEPVRGVRIAIEPGAEIAGHVNVPLEGQNVRLEPISPDAPDALAVVQKGDTFAALVNRGTYTLDTRFLGEYIVEAVQLDGRDVTASALDNGINISGGNLTMELVLSKNGGALTGQVADKDGNPVSGATVLLAPDAPRRSHPSQFRTVQTDQNGGYQFKTLQPGPYKLFAFTGVEPEIWCEPGFLARFESKGEPVKVESGSHDSKNLTALEGRY
jgi:hypothetical protein